MLQNALCEFLEFGEYIIKVTSGSFVLLVFKYILEIILLL